MYLAHHPILLPFLPPSAPQPLLAAVKCQQLPVHLLLVHQRLLLSSTRGTRATGNIWQLIPGPKLLAATPAAAAAAAGPCHCQRTQQLPVKPLTPSLLLMAHPTTKSPPMQPLR
mgnify:CR=1 FL=1